MQTLVASSDGKGEEEKQAPALSKLGLIKARDEKIPILFLKDLCPSCACLAVGLNLHETNSGKLGYRILDLGSLPPPGIIAFSFIVKQKQNKQTRTLRPR